MVFPCLPPEKREKAIVEHKFPVVASLKHFNTKA